MSRASLCCSYLLFSTNKVFTLLSALSDLSKDTNSGVYRSQGETQNSLHFLWHCRDGTKCSAWNKGLIADYGRAAAMTAHLLSLASRAAGLEIKTSSVRTSGSCQPDNCSLYISVTFNTENVHASHGVRDRVKYWIQQNDDCFCRHDFSYYILNLTLIIVI